MLGIALLVNNGNRTAGCQTISCQAKPGIILAATKMTEDLNKEHDVERGAGIKCLEISDHGPTIGSASKPSITGINAGLREVDSQVFDSVTALVVICIDYFRPIPHTATHFENSNPLHTAFKSSLNFSTHGLMKDLSKWYRRARPIKYIMQLDELILDHLAMGRVTVQRLPGFHRLCTFQFRQRC